MARPIDILNQRLDQRLLELEMTDHQASMLATGKPDLIRDIRRGRMPGSPRLVALSDVLQVSVTWLLGDDTAPTGASQPPAPAAVQSPRREFDPQQSPRDLPVLGSVLGCPLDFTDGAPVESHLLEMGEVIEYVRRAPGLRNNKDSYALYVAGDSQSPRFRAGDLVFVNTRRPAAIGDDVVVQLADNGGEIITALIKTLTRRGPQEIELEQYNPPRRFTVPLSSIADGGRAIHRIMPLTELLGV